MTSRAEAFARDRYLRLDTFISRRRASQLCAEAWELWRAGETRDGDRMVPGTPAVYGAPAMDQALRELQPRLQRATGVPLLPTYSYLRIYQGGDQLARHRDRPACEVSVSLMLGGESSRPWPLWIEGARGARAFSLSPGDAVAYRGLECDHWRTRFRGQWHCQLFLHYVDRYGPHADWRYDHRPRLGLPVSAREVG